MKNRGSDMAAILTSCNDERFESLLESHDAAGENAGDGIVNGLEAAEHHVVEIVYNSKKNVIMNQKNLLPGLLMLAALTCMYGCGNSRSSKSKPRPIWEYRIERYLERVATEADLSLREAQEIYREACEKQSAADSVSAKDTISLYEARYVEAKARLEEAWSHVDRWYEYDEDYETAYAKYEELSKSLIVIMETYDRAMEELRTARGEMVKVAEDDLDDVESARMKIATYRDILNTPSEEWTQEDSVLLDHIYNFCRKAESEGWGYNISTRLVRYMQKLK